MTDAAATTGGPDLVAFARPCLHCRGAGVVKLFECELCHLQAVFDGETHGRLYRAYDLCVHKPGPRLPRPQEMPEEGNRVSCWPDCGHRLNLYLLVRWTAACPRCDGTGEVVILLPPEEAARREAKREAQTRQAWKWAEARLALWMRETEGHREAREFLPPCEARCRDGHACRRKCEWGRLRCHRHRGGTGPTTPEGKAAIADSNRRRAGQKKGGCNQEKPVA